MSAVKIRAIGNAKGVVLPQEVLKKLNCAEGDNLYIIETKDGIELTPFDPEFAADMAMAERIMAKNKNLLRKLAE